MRDNYTTVAFCPYFDLKWRCFVPSEVRYNAKTHIFTSFQCTVFVALVATLVADKVSCPSSERPERRWFAGC